MRLIRGRALLALAVLLGIGVEARPQGFTNFSVYVSLGDSLTAGVVSSGLVQTRQVNSYPALIARQGRASGFQQPLIAEPGRPPELALLSLPPALVIAPKSATPGDNLNAALTRPYNNLGVPGSRAANLPATVSDGGGNHDLVLRGMGTALAQALSLRPTLVTLWIGNNDVLAAAVSGRVIEGVTLTPAATFRATYQQIVTALRTTGAGIIAANLPDVTSIPYVTTIPPVVVNPANNQPVLVNGQPIALLGPAGPLPSGSYVTLAAASLLAQGIGIPAALGGRGVGLPDEVVLDPAETAAIRERVNANNQAIREICGSDIPIFDSNAFLREMSTSGRSVGGVRISSAFLTGGLISYDGVHPTELGYALVANEFIRILNSKGAQLDEVDLSPLLGLRARSTARQAYPVEFSWEAYEALLALFPLER
jgi:lysophospholipase L1-like esterase